MKALTQEQRDIVIREYKAHMTYEAIAEKHGISTSTVNNILRKQGLTGHMLRSPKETMRLYKDIAKDYYNKKPIKDICEVYGVQRPRIYLAINWVNAHLAEEAKIKVREPAKGRKRA